MDGAAQTQIDHVVIAALRHRHDVVDLHQVGRPAGHAGERVLVAASPTVPSPHRTSHRLWNVPPPPARAGGFGCWRARRRAISGQPRSHTGVQLGGRPGRPLPCPRRLLVLRRTRSAAANLLASRGRYCLRLPVRRRTAGRCDAGVGRNRTGRRRAGSDRAGVARSPSTTPIRCPRRLLVLRRTATACARGAGGDRTACGKAAINRAGVARSPIATPVRDPRRLLVLRRTAGKCDAGAGGDRSGCGAASNRTRGNRTAGSRGRGHPLARHTSGAGRRAGLGRSRAHRTSGDPAFAGAAAFLLARFGGPRRHRRPPLGPAPLPHRVVLPLRLLQQVGEQLPGGEARVHVRQPALQLGDGVYTALVQDHPHRVAAAAEGALLLSRQAQLGLQFRQQLLGLTGRLVGDQIDQFDLLVPGPCRWWFRRGRRRRRLGGPHPGAATQRPTPTPPGMRPRPSRLRPRFPPPATSPALAPALRQARLPGFPRLPSAPGAPLQPTTPRRPHLQRPSPTRSPTHGRPYGPLSAHAFQSRSATDSR